MGDYVGSDKTTGQAHTAAEFNAMKAAVNSKADKVTGKSLVDNTEITKLAAISGTNSGDETTSRINALYGYTPANPANYSNVNNTSDVNKPVSTLQAAADTAATAAAVTAIRNGVTTAGNDLAKLYALIPSVEHGTLSDAATTIWDFSLYQDVDWTAADVRTLSVTNMPAGVSFGQIKYISTYEPVLPGNTNCVFIDPDGVTLIGFRYDGTFKWFSDYQAGVPISEGLTGYFASFTNKVGGSIIESPPFTFYTPTSGIPTYAVADQEIPTGINGWIQADIPNDVTSSAIVIGLSLNATPESYITGLTYNWWLVYCLNGFYSIGVKDTDYTVGDQTSVASAAGDKMRMRRVDDSNLIAEKSSDGGTTWTTIREMVLDEDEVAGVLYGKVQFFVAGPPDEPRLLVNPKIYK